MKFIAQNERKISVKESGYLHRIYLKNISYIRSESYLSIIYFINKKAPLTVSKLLKEFEEELFKYGFIRINHSTLVNKVHISSIGNCKNREVCINGNKKLTISHRKYAKIIKLLTTE